MYRCACYYIKDASVAAWFEGGGLCHMGGGVWKRCCSI